MNQESRLTSACARGTPVTSCSGLVAKDPEADWLDVQPSEPARVSRRATSLPSKATPNLSGNRLLASDGLSDEARWSRMVVPPTPRAHSGACQRLIPAAVSTVLGLCNVVADSIPVIGAFASPDRGVQVVRRRSQRGQLTPSSTSERPPACGDAMIDERDRRRVRRRTSDLLEVREQAGRSLSTPSGISRGWSPERGRECHLIAQPFSSRPTNLVRTRRR